MLGCKQYIRRRPSRANKFEAEIYIECIFKIILFRDTFLKNKYGYSNSILISDLEKDFVC